MKATYRNRTIAMVSALILIGIGGVSAFSLGLYRREKLLQIRQDSGQGIQRLADHLQSLLLLAQNVSLQQAGSSPEVIFVADRVCGARAGTRDFAVNPLFTRHFEDVELSPEDWLRTLEVYKACTSPLISRTPGQTILLSTDIRLMVPYLTALVRTDSSFRLVALSMESFQSGAGSTVFLTNRQGRVLWSADGQAFLKAAFLDTGLTPAKLEETIAAPHEGWGLTDIGMDGLLAHAPVTEDWTLFSLSYKPTLLQPVNYALVQSAYLIAAMLLICLFFGKRIAESIVGPLAELRRSADLIGKGKFDARFEVTGENEVSAVKRAFNVMIDKIQALLEQVQSKAKLEAELRTVEGVHRMLFPPNSVRISRHSIFSAAQTAATCGGDWWGYLELPREGRAPLVVLLIGDVTGHGTESALVTAAVRGGFSVMAQYLEALGSDAPDTSVVLRYFNRAVYESAGGVLGMTFFAAVLDTEKQELHCANAGHNRPYLLLPKQAASPDGEQGPQEFEVKPIGFTEGGPLGYAVDTAYDKVETHPWPPGAKLFLYTDGLVETDLFNRNRLRKTLVASARMSARALLSKVMQAHRAAAGEGPHSDDITAVLCETSEGT